MSWLGGGAALGAAAGVVLATLEALWLVGHARDSLGAPWEAARLVLGVFLICGACGVAIGLLEALAARGVDWVARVLSRRSARPVGQWRADLVTLLATPLLLRGALAAFAGPQARSLPGQRILSALLFLGGLTIVHRLAAAAPRLDPSVGTRRRWIPVLLSAALTAAYLTDRRVWPGSYHAFHLGLRGLEIALSQLAVHLATGGRLARRPGVSPSLLCGAILALAASALLARSARLSTRTIEHTALAGPAWGLLHRAIHGPLVARTAVVSPPPPPSTPGPRLGLRDVLLITVDALRADRVTPALTPNLTALTRQGIWFERAYAPAPYTSLSLSVLHTGSHVPGRLDRRPLPLTLAERLRDRGYRTVALYPPEVLNFDPEDRALRYGAKGFGFEAVISEWWMSADVVTDRILATLRDDPGSAPIFTWVHYVEPHQPYHPHPGLTQENDDARVQQDGEIAFFDRHLGRLLAHFRATRPHTLVILTADHGEAFGEHGFEQHGHTLYEEEVRVPLLFVTLDQAGLPQRVLAGPVGLIDVAPTILSLLGQPTEGTRGRDLSPWMGPAPLAVPLGPAFAELRPRQMVVDGTDKLICDLDTASCQLFDLARDPRERDDLVDGSPIAARLREVLLRDVEAR